MSVRSQVDYIKYMQQKCIAYMCKTECETFAALQDNKLQSKSLQLAVNDLNEQNEMNHLIPSLVCV